MDMQAAVEMHELEKAVKEHASEFETIFVAPLGDNEPDDGILTYGHAVGVEDLVRGHTVNVLLFSDDDLDLLEMLVKYAPRFKASVKVLVGLPQTSYSADWQSKTWMLDKVSYPTLVSELALASQVEKERKVANATVVEREQAQYTRADGTVKDYTNFDVALPDDGDLE